MDSTIKQMKTYISNLVRTARLLNNLHQVRSKSKIISTFGNNKTKWHKQNIQNPLRLPVHEGEQPFFLY
jgi:hypothetical protein